MSHIYLEECGVLYRRNMKVDPADARETVVTYQWEHVRGNRGEEKIVLPYPRATAVRMLVRLIERWNSLGNDIWRYSLGADLPLTHAEFSW